MKNQIFEQEINHKFKRYETSDEDRRKEKSRHIFTIYHNASLFMIPSPQLASTLHVSFSLVAPGPYHDPQPWYQDHPQRSVVDVAR